MKFIHCADLHLESKMESNFSSQLASERRRELLFTFKRLLEYANETHADGVLIAGDMFDRNVTVRTLKSVLSYLQGTACPVYYLCGNHDDHNLSDLVTLPENCFTFGEGWTSYRLGDVVVTSTEAFGDDAVSSLSLNADDCNIVMLHGQIADQNDKYAIRLSSLQNKNIDYLALGHIHSYAEGKLDERGTYAYSGCIEGRGFDECGEKGFVELTVEGKKITKKFVPFASLTLHEVEVPLSVHINTPYAVENAMEQKLASIPKTDMVKVVFSGQRDPDFKFDPVYYEDSLRGRFRFSKVKDRSRLAIFADDYKNDVSLKGEFVRLVRASKLSPEDQDRVLECGIRALRGEEVDG